MFSLYPKIIKKPEISILTFISESHPLCMSSRSSSVWTRTQLCVRNQYIHFYSFYLLCCLL